ncbi:unnamed protein product [Closterium sp. NIES-53]
MSSVCCRAHRSLKPHRLLASLVPASSAVSRAPPSREAVLSRELCPPEASPRARAAAHRAVGSGARESGDPAEPWQRWPSREPGAARDAARAETHAAGGTSGLGGASEGAGWRGMAAGGAGRGGEVGAGAWTQVMRGGQAVSSTVHAGSGCGRGLPSRRLLCSAPSLAAAAALDGGGSMDIFNRRLKAMQRDRAAADMASTHDEVPRGDPLVEQVASVLLDRLADCRRTFSSVLLLGGAALPSVLTTLLRTHPAVQRVVVMHVSPTALALARAHLPAHAVCCNDALPATDDRWSPLHTARPAAASTVPAAASTVPAASAAARVEVAFVLADEEHLPFHASSFDAVIACLGLHWVNDLPAAMTHIRCAGPPCPLLCRFLFPRILCRPKHPFHHSIRMGSSSPPCWAATPSGTAMATPSGTAMATPSGTAMATPSGTAMATPSGTAMATPSGTAMATPSGTAMATPSGTAMATPSGTAMATPSGTAMATPSGTAMATPSGTAMATPSGTAMATPSGTAMATPSGTAMATPSGTAMATPSGTAMGSVRCTAMGCSRFSLLLASSHLSPYFFHHCSLVAITAPPSLHSCPLLLPPPSLQVRDAGNLLIRPGFALPTVDVDEFPIAYPSAVQVVQHLRSLGETDCTLHHAQPLPRDTALAAAAIYAYMFPARPPPSDAHSPPDLASGAEARGAEEQGRDEDGVVATFQVIFMAGWAPHESQQRARPRGSAAASLHALQHSLPTKP